VARRLLVRQEKYGRPSMPSAKAAFSAGAMSVAVTIASCVAAAPGEVALSGPSGFRGPGDTPSSPYLALDARGPWQFFQLPWGTSPASEVESLVVSFAGTGISTRDHSASIAKKPVTFSTIWRASSRSGYARAVASRLHASGRSDCRLLRAVVSPTTSRPASRRTVPLASGFGIRPINLGPRICFFGVSFRGITVGYQLCRNIRFHDRKLVALACRYDQQPATACAGLARDRVVEVAVLDTLNDKTLDEIKSGSHLRRIVSRCGGRNIRFTHCEAALS
jgi:hypothetical protein